MSQLDKLLIRGVRSFDPQTVAVIEFYTPLTLIVGHNGAGKTTIIECLKYATTGDLPPNSKNGAFIHDPKLANETEVKAQIKLAFSNVNRKDMVCTRSISLTKKKNAYTQKTLESLLSTKNEKGESVSISSKCAELDLAMPEQLGVSKAILENVIFCHQEESFWPLSESGVLKKKFDEIFAATRYSKALENVKTLRKNQAVQIKLHSNDLQHMKFNREKASEIGQSITDIEKRIEDAHRRRNQIENVEISQVSAEIRSLEVEMQELQKLKDNLSRLDIERNNIEKNIREFQDIKVLSENTNELYSILENYNDSFQRIARESKSLEDQIPFLEGDLKRKENNLLDVLRDKGKFEAEKQTIERKKRDKQSLLSDIKAFFNLYDISHLDDRNPESAAQKLKVFVGEYSQTITTTRENFDLEEAELLSKEQDLRLAIDSAKNMKSLMLSQISEKQKRLREMTNRRNLLSAVDNDAGRMRQNVMEEEEKLNSLRRSLEESDIPSLLSIIDDQLHKWESKRKAASENLKFINLQSEVRMNINLKKMEVGKSNTRITEILEAVRVDLSTLTGRFISEYDIEKELKDSLRSNGDQRAALERQWEFLKNDISILRSKLDGLQKSEEEKERDLKKKRAMIQKVCKEEDYLRLSDEIEKAYEEESSSEKTFTNAANIFKKYIQIYERVKHCPLCLRGFPSDAEAQAFLEKLQTNLAKIPNEEEQLALVQQKAKSRKTFQDLQPVWNDVRRIADTELPSILREKKTVSAKLEELRRKLPEAEKNLDEKRSKAEGLEKCRRSYEESQQLKSEAEILQLQIGSLEAELMGQGSTKSSMELQEELDTSLHKCNQLSKEKEDQASVLRQKQDAIKDKDSLVKDLKSKLQSLEVELKERSRLDSELRDLKTDIEKCNNELESKESGRGHKEPELKSVRDSLQSLREKKSRHERESNVKMQKAQQFLSTYRNIETDILRSSASNPESALNECERNIEMCRKEMDSIKQEISRLKDKVSTINQDHAEISLMLRNVQDNIKLRQLQKDLVSKGEQIDRLRRDIAVYNGQASERKLKTLTGKYEVLCNELAALSGEVKQMELQLSRFRSELDKDYKDVFTRYIEQAVQVKAETLANEDLDKYSKALENAIMKYHSMKMEEINKIIRELWVNTYKGNDIETIEIRSDNENVKGNRTYNYRVVMIKEQTELDMRGRCSAGQKVLAALIIRLALAETFCLNCGILALDEPTTNLDTENSESLAESLASIIKIRRLQKNFQLIVITHDEEFMRLLGKSEFADYYWRISKDFNMHSIVEKQKISE